MLLQKKASSFKKRFVVFCLSKKRSNFVLLEEETIFAEYQREEQNKRKAIVLKTKK